MPPLVLIADLAPSPEDVSDAAADLRGRREKVRALGEAIGVEVAVVAAAEVASAAALDEALLRRAAAAWWIGRIAFPRETGPLAAALRARLDAAGARATPVLDDPDAADEAFSLARFYPLLEAAGVPQARTRLLPLSPAEAALPEEALEPLLRERIDAAGLAFPEEGVFYRSYYGTLKIASGLNGAFSREELAEGGARLVARLRVGQEIGGIAVREMLAIPSRWLKKGRAIVRRELRCFAAFGRPVAWTLAGSHAEFRVEKIAQATLAEVAAVTPALREEVRALVARTARALRVRFLVVDLTILADGRVVVLETNPGFGCHWYHPAVFVASYAAFLRAAAGLPPLSSEEVCAAAARLGLEGEPGGRDAVWGLFEGA